MGALWRLQQWEKRLWTQIWLTGKRFVWKAQIRKTEGGQKGQQETHEHRGNVEAHTHQGTAPFSPFKFYLLFLFFEYPLLVIFFIKLHTFLSEHFQKYFSWNLSSFHPFLPFFCHPSPLTHYLSCLFLMKDILLCLFLLNFILLYNSGSTNLLRCIFVVTKMLFDFHSFISSLFNPEK